MRISRREDRILRRNAGNMVGPVTATIAALQLAEGETPLSAGELDAVVERFGIIPTIDPLGLVFAATRRVEHEGPLPEDARHLGALTALGCIAEVIDLHLGRRRQRSAYATAAEDMRAGLRLLNRSVPGVIDDHLARLARLGQ